MKKLIIAFVIIGIVIAAAVCETVYLNKTYDGLLDRLEIVNDNINADLENVDNPSTIGAMERTVDFWEDRRTLTMALINHTQTKLIDERLTAALAQIKVNANTDASVSITGAIKMFNDLKKDILPNIGNLL